MNCGFWVSLMVSREVEGGEKFSFGLELSEGVAEGGN